MKLAFMLSVTAYLLARAFAAAAVTGGAEGLAEVVAYGATAAFGLEFLASSWQSRFRAV